MLKIGNLVYIKEHLLLKSKVLKTEVSDIQPDDMFAVSDVTEDDSGDIYYLIRDIKTGNVLRHNGDKPVVFSHNDLIEIVSVSFVNEEGITITKILSD